MSLNRLSRLKSLFRHGPQQFDQLIVGARFWTLGRDSHLWSPIMDCAWPFRAELKAGHLTGPADRYWGYTDMCRRSCEHCGIYAYNLNLLHPHSKNWGWRADLTFGSVYLWGDVHIHEYGYRAQFAYPRHLVASDLVDVVRILELESNYGVSVDMAATFEEALAKEKAHGQEINMGNYDPRWQFL